MLLFAACITTEATFGLFSRQVSGELFVVNNLAGSIRCLMAAIDEEVVEEGMKVLTGRIRNSSVCNHWPSR